MSGQGNRPFGPRGVTNEEILQDMRITAQACPRGELSGKRYQKIGRYSQAIVTDRFGSWNNAMWLALPEVMRLRHPTIEDLIADVHRVADECRVVIVNRTKRQNERGGVFKFSTAFYKRHGLYGWYDMSRGLGEHFKVKTWTELKGALGITDV